jgi:hypothetical protein
MGQAGPFKPVALVVEDDVLQSDLAAALLEESKMGVIRELGNWNRVTHASILVKTADGRVVRKVPLK